MRKTTVLALAAALVVTASCGARHPSKVTVNPNFEPADVGTILLAPTVSMITEGEDPRRQSETIPDRIIWEQLSGRYDYSFLSPQQFTAAVYKAGLGSELESVMSKWAGEHVIDIDFLRAIKSELDIDMIMIPVVYLWYKDEADYREAATASATQVGMTLTMIDPLSGEVMWEASDENYSEAVRTEGERVQASSGGIDRRIAGTTATGRDMYAAPPFEDVTVLVVGALVNAIPGKMSQTVR